MSNIQINAHSLRDSWDRVNTSGVPNSRLLGNVKYWYGDVENSTLPPTVLQAVLVAAQATIENDIDPSSYRSLSVEDLTVLCKVLANHGNFGRPPSEISAKTVKQIEKFLEVKSSWERISASDLPNKGLLGHVQYWYGNLVTTALPVPVLRAIAAVAGTARDPQLAPVFEALSDKDLCILYHVLEKHGSFGRPPSPISKRAADQIKAYILASTPEKLIRIRNILHADYNSSRLTSEVTERCNAGQGARVLAGPVAGALERPMPGDQLIDFYLGHSAHPSGSTFDQILGWDDARLERQHDYIQWLFPLTVISRHNRSAPLMTRERMNAFHSTPRLQENMMRAYSRMLTFYGFTRAGDGTLQRSDRFAEKSRNWLSNGNHNYLRMTRIMTSLSLAGYPNDARQFYVILRDIYTNEGRGKISENTFRIWTNASGINR